MTDARRDERLQGDVERVDAARRLLPDLTGHPSLDRLAALAARLLGSAAAQVSLLTDVQTIAGGAGLTPGSVGRESPLSESLCTVTARSGGPLVVSDARHDDRVAQLPPVTSGALGSYLGVPLLDAAQRTVGALCIFGPEPRDWSEADVSLLEELAVATVAELELSALAAEYNTVRVRLGLAIEAAGIGSFDLDVTNGRLAWDERLVEMFGYDAATFDQTLDAFTSRVHPDDRAQVTRGLQETIDTGGELDLDYRIVLPDGDTRWMASRGRALLGEDGTTVRVLGAAFDTTDERDGALRVARVLETMPTAFYSLDRHWRFSYVNARAEELLGRTRADLLGGEVWELYPDALGSDFEAAYRGAMRTAQPVHFEAYYPPPLDHWYELTAWPGPDGLSVYFHDVTERRAARDQAERDRAAADAARRDAERSREEAERAADRINLLGEVSVLFAAELDPELAVSRLARQVVPALGDWCLVSVLTDQGELRDVGAWHVDPAKQDVLEDYSRLRLAALNDSSFVAQALRTGQPAVVPAPATKALIEVLETGRAQELITLLAPEHGVVLPMVARGRTLGLLSVFSGTARGPMNLVDLATAGEVARRAALGMDTARLYRQQRNLAEGLQRSLLTAPPEPDHMQIVVRYVPAAEEAQVGGDWYDAFLQPDGSTVVCIGDVVGHDTAAAAGMGQVRGLLRGIAYTSGASPGAVLTSLDEAIIGLQVGTTATAVVARIEQDDEQRREGARVLRWSNAGHPPPIVVSWDGTVEVLDAASPNLLLGIAPHLPRTESVVTLEPGATVLFYTDGLVERRTEHLDHGLARLCGVLEQVFGLGLDEMCDELIARMLPGEPEDDVALVVLRLNRLDRPRPSAAGPRRVPPGVPPEPA